MDRMTLEWLAASTRATIVSTIRSVQPLNRALDAAVIKVPHRQVMEEVLSIPEIQKVLAYLKEKESWFYPVFALWLSTGLRNAELIGLTWDAVRLAEGELLITKSLRRDGVNTHLRRWGTTKTGRSRVVPLNPEIVDLLQQHRQRMGELGLDSHKGLVFVWSRSHGHLYDSGLEQVWKRAQQRVGLEPRRLYAQRHSFLSHALAMGIVLPIWQQWQDIGLSSSRKPTRNRLDGSRCRVGHSMSEKTSSGTNSMISSSCDHTLYLPCRFFVDLGVSELWR
mgnify:CR=1 FL=1